MVLLGIKSFYFPSRFDGCFSLYSTYSEFSAVCNRLPITLNIFKYTNVSGQSDGKFFKLELEIFL